MSTYNERYDEALSKTSWVSQKASHGKTYLLKYAPHPERTGYLFAATDLETVHFEVMTAPSIPTRLGQIAERENRPEEADAINSLGFEEQQQRTDDLLKQLSDTFEGHWSSASIDLESDDYFDAVFVLRSSSLTWSFNVTELRGRQPLSFISKQLLSPLALLLAQDRGVDTPPAGRSTSEVVGAVISDPGVVRAVRRVTGAPPPASNRATPAPRIKPSASPTPKPQSRQPSLSPTPRATHRTRTPPKTKSPIARPATPERASASQTLPPLINPSSPTPHARRAYDFAAGILPSSEPSSPGHTSTPGDRSSPIPASKHILVPETKVSSPPPSSPPRRPHGLDLQPEHLTSASLAEHPSSTQDPLVPTQDKKMKKKRDKKEETQEELEAEKRRAEMKRRMAAGGGGGRLGRRRL